MSSARARPAGIRDSGPGCLHRRGSSGFAEHRRELLLRLRGKARRRRPREPARLRLRCRREGLDEPLAEAHRRLEVADRRSFPRPASCAALATRRRGRRSHRRGRAGAPCRRPTRGLGRFRRPAAGSCAAPPRRPARNRPYIGFDARSGSAGSASGDGPFNRSGSPESRVVFIAVGADHRASGACPGSSGSSRRRRSSR